MNNDPITKKPYPSMKEEVAENSKNVRLLLPDEKVLTHEGKTVRFYTDLIKGKVVVLSFFFLANEIDRGNGGRLEKEQL